MKNTIKKIPVSLCAAAVCAAVLAGTSALAIPVTEFSGSITFSATGVTTDNPILQDDTKFSLAGVTTATTTGTYSTLGVNDEAVSFTGFTFTGPGAAATVIPLWTFDVGQTVFGFDATSVTAQWVNTVGSSGEWIISGTGMASISGYTDTPGTWTVNLSDSGNLAVAFDATADASPTVPDGGTTVTLLGGAFLGLGLFRRKFRN
jgi:hypothetical protein